MTDRTIAGKLLEPARNVRNRLWARRAGVGPRATPIADLPEPSHDGDADRGAALLAGRWQVMGREIALGGGSIWAAPLPDPRLVAEREACGWIDDLAALGSRPARALAQAWALEWARRSGGGAGPGWRPETTGLRAMRWVAHAAFLTGGLEPTDAARIWGALTAQQRYLARAWPHAAPGLARMRALAGLVWTGRVLPHPEHGAAVAQFGALAAGTIGPDGGVGSRSPEDSAETLALLVWTARLLEDGGEGAAPGHFDAVVRAVPVLRQLRMGGGFLARFNGGGAGDPIAIDKALAELRLEAQPRMRLPMGYARLVGGRIVLLMDGAEPPGGPWADRAHAGALSFEMSVGRTPLVVNQGPGAGSGPERAAARLTPAHSTVEVEGRSSAALAGTALVAGPSLVSVRQAHDASGMWLLATHDGFVSRVGLLHERRIFVDARGIEARGEEILSVTDARAREVFDRAARAAGRRLEFAARFHLHPEIEVRFDPGPEVALLTLPSGEVWELRAGGGAVSVEPSVYFDASRAEPRPTRQVVVRAEVVEYLGQITWSFGRIVEAPRAPDAERPR